MLSSTQPDFVVTSVPREVNVTLIQELASHDMPILSETPPAPDIDGLLTLNALGARVQVAEQYHLQPLHAARIALARTGKLGAVSHAEVSAAHAYHGISLVRRLLGIGYERCTITGTSFTSPLMKGPGREGAPKTEGIIDAAEEFCWLDFGDQLGVFNFSDAQYFSWIRTIPAYSSAVNVASL